MHLLSLSHRHHVLHSHQPTIYLGLRRMCTELCVTWKWEMVTEEKMNWHCIWQKWLDVRVVWNWEKLLRSEIEDVMKAVRRKRLRWYWLPTCFNKGMMMIW